jgi:isocitrate lyase
MPDTGLISYAEMLEVGRRIHEATNTIPIIGDGDTGYGNAMNVKRTVRGYASAGFAGKLRVPVHSSRLLHCARCGSEFMFQSRQ